MGQLHHLVCCLLTEAMDQGALTPIDPELLTRFLLDGLHGALLPWPIRTSQTTSAP